MRLSLVLVEPHQLDSTAEHLAFWKIFQMQRAAPGRNRGHDADTTIEEEVCVA